MRLIKLRLEKIGLHARAPSCRSLQASDSRISPASAQRNGCEQKEILTKAHFHGLSLAMQNWISRSLSRSTCPWRVPAVLLLLGCALLHNGCADAFIPPPENRPVTPYEEAPEPHLGKPADL
jgi:hypothetical protein